MLPADAAFLDVFPVEPGRGLSHSGKQAAEGVAARRLSLLPG
jgi:hypothetical protein